MHPVRRNLRPRVSQLLEQLESRVLLHGLTLITHGYEPISNDRPGWITSMGNAIKARTDSTTAVYTLRLEPVNNSTAHVTNFSRLSGPSPDSSSSDNAETVLLLDWASVSGIISDDYSVEYLATVVSPYLLTTFPNIGINVPLAEGAVHLMGHSRGSPFVSEIARLLGQRGVWVDQLTLFDPVPSPLNDDPDVVVKDNVIFADNYYQRSGNGLTIPNGSSISGAYNAGPLKLGGAYGPLTGGTHNDVHLYYHGTIDTASNASDGNHQVPNNWYSNNHANRATTGFYYSRLGGGSDVRPASGISSLFGGMGSRSTITTHVDSQWPNLAFVFPSTQSIESSDDFAISFSYQTSVESQVQWFLDPDTNPYNNNSIALGSETSYASTGTTLVTHGSITLNANAALGSYNLEGRITNGSQSRYSYSSSLVHVVSSLTELVLTQQPTDVTAGSTFAPVVTVAIQDLGGNTVTDNTSSVTITIASGPQNATLGGTTTVQAVNGVATFSDLLLTRTGDYTFTVTDGVLEPIVTNPFTVSPDMTTTQLRIVQQPVNTVVGKSLAPPLILNVADQFGNVITTDKSKVTLSIFSGPASSALKGTTSLNFKNGSATFSNLSLTQAGNYTLQATDTALAITTLQFNQAVTPATTTLTAPKPATAYSFGQSFTLSTTFKSDAPTSIPFGGTATIVDDQGHAIATDDLATNGQAQFKLTSVAPGTYNCVIAYAGDNNHTSATSPGFTLVINAASTKVNLTVSPTSLVLGQPLTLTANVTANTGGSSARTGSINFYDNGNLLITVALDGNSTAIFPLPNAAIGKHTYSASYSGDPTFGASTSATKSVTVNPHKTQTALTYTTLPLIPNQTFSLLAGVSVLAPGSGTPTGTITFKEGSTVLGTATLSGTTAAIIISYPAAGTHKITAVYSGNGNSNTSTSLVLTLTITPAPVI